MAQTVLITGAAGGIGRATAEKLLAEGFAVYGADRDADRLATLRHPAFRPLIMDVRCDGAVRDGIARLVEEAGRIDHLFANAGYCLIGPVELQDPAAVSQQFDVNVTGVGRVIAQALPHMRAARRGRIAICASAAGHVGLPGMAWYSASKFALRGLAQGLRMEVAEFGISVSLIEPGFIDTGIAEASCPTLDACQQHPAFGAYRAQMQAFRRNRIDVATGGDGPETVAAAVHRAFSDRRPRRHYRPNRDTRFIVAVQRIFGDWLAERIVPRATIR